MDVQQKQNTPKVACLQGESTLENSIFISISELRVDRLSSSRHWVVVVQNHQLWRAESGLTKRVTPSKPETHRCTQAACCRVRGWRLPFVLVQRPPSPQHPICCPGTRTLACRTLRKTTRYRTTRRPYSPSLLPLLRLPRFLSRLLLHKQSPRLPLSMR